MAGSPAGVDEAERRLPPIAQVAVLTMVLVIAGGTYVAAYLPRRAPMALPIALLAAAGLLLIGNVVTLARLRGFAWDKFFLVARWALLAYLIIAGMLEYVFALDGTPADLLVFLTFTLAIFAIDIPLLFAFSVARYQPSSGSG
ncbi:MAG: hypothetical protein KGJ86_00440 [Chloroflexota bacterium]|nr:hypothetical protein [Chloroflexota bacterium]